MTARAVRILVALALGIGLFVFAYFAPRATAAEPERCQIFVQRPGDDWKPFTTKGRSVWTFTSCTACSMDMNAALKGEVSGTAMACVDIKKTMVRQ